MTTETMKTPVTDKLGATRAMFFASAAMSPMLRGPMVAFAPDGNEGGSAEGVVTDTTADADTDTTQTADQAEDDTDADAVDGGDADDQADADDDDLEDVEWEGKKARVPAEIKAALMRQDDYTRKTQAVADERKALEAKAQTVAQQAEEAEALKADYGKVHALDLQVKAFEAINWDELDREAAASEDPISAQAEINKLERQYRRLVAERDGAQKDLDGKVSERRLQSEREAATATQETFRQLSDPKTGIKGWGQEKATTLANLAMSEGVTVEEIKQADARTWKLLDRLHRAESQLTKQKAANSHASAQQTTPAKAVSGKTTPPAGLDDRLSTSNCLWT